MLVPIITTMIEWSLNVNKWYLLFERRHIVSIAPELQFLISSSIQRLQNTMNFNTVRKNHV
jgi:hypothetical protein